MAIIKEQSVAVVTYIYPAAIPYLKDLIICLNNQQKKGFSLIVFNDGVENLEFFLQDLDIDYKVINIDGSPVSIRFKSLNILKKFDVDFLIFQDADDLMTEDRVLVCTALLNNYSLVCNDLDILISNNQIKKQQIWKDRFVKHATFDFTSIKESNFVGFGNTSIRKEVLENLELHEPLTSILAADWFIFFLILYENNLTGIFTSNCRTIYRQHSDNIAGIDDINATRIKQAIEVKLYQYEALNECGFNFGTEICEMMNMRSGFEYYKLKPVKQQPFWWEETTLVEQNIK